MSVLTELPHSVLFDKSANPDKSSLARVQNGLRVTEPLGQHRQHNRSERRAYHIEDNAGALPDRHLLFTPTEHVDTISFVDDGNPLLKAVRKNGVWIELLLMDPMGRELATTQYDQKQGSVIETLLTDQALSSEPAFPLALSEQHRDLVSNSCAVFRSSTEPSMEMLLALSSFFSDVLTTKQYPTPEQAPLFPHQLQLPRFV